MKPTDCDGSVYICISGVCLGDSVFLRRFYSRPFTTGVDGSGGWWSMRRPSLFAFLCRDIEI